MRIQAVIASLIVSVVVGCASEEATSTTVSDVVTTCTAQNVAGWPYSGTVCGGSVIDTCSKGATYTCSGGARGSTNNCTLKTSCSVGCLTGTTSTPVTVNTSSPSASDACFTGTAPLSFSTSTPTGGNNVTMTATLSQTHTPYAIVNLQGTTSLVPPLCNPPLLLPTGSTTVSWTEPTGVVGSSTNVPLNVLLSFNDGAGIGRTLVSVPSVLTLGAGGSITTPALASLAITDGLGNPISTITGGTNAFAGGTLAQVAPVGGVSVAVSSSPSTAFTTNGSFTIDQGCTTNSTLGVLTATSSLTSNLSATLSATTGAGSPQTQGVTITPPPLKIQSVTLTPSTVTGGTSTTVTVTLNRIVLASDASSTVTVRLSEGLLSGTPLATFTGCTGSPACTGPLAVGLGAASANLTVSTFAIGSSDQITISASAPWSNSSASKNLTINP